MATTIWPHGDPRDVARAIVADPRYGRPRLVETHRTWLDVARDWVVGLLRALVHRLDHALGERNPFGVAIGIAVVAAALGLLAYAIVVLVRAAARGRPTRRLLVGDAAIAATSRSAADLRAAARAAAARGAYRTAAGLLFAAAARALDERGRLAYDPARTPGEYRRLIRDPVFDGFASDAVTAVFAAEDPPDDLYERMDTNYDRLFDPGVA